EDFSGEEEYFEILTEPADFSDLRKALESKGYNFLQAEVQMVPQTTTTLTDPKQVEQMNKLIDNIEDLDDVQNVYHNWEENE
ncbi:MAG: YebC/PmpR family DNA-binding transcriptional regulator, partial [Clostridiaceae bacterium]|nr:YebC/PmpR family DNA-binding transcriptional regulator [Clostridiaceae bacterium]